MVDRYRASKSKDEEKITAGKMESRYTEPQPAPDHERRNGQGEAEEPDNEWRNIVDAVEHLGRDASRPPKHRCQRNKTWPDLAAGLGSSSICNLVTR
ncbi:hypothetical protein MesoLjLc_49260 [Mesorhizobium sp. L-8-10]|nr:hypothetical protein MesoLjLc_49260 [Mesorhizobium sp. L-8-10]